MPIPFSDARGAFAAFAVAVALTWSQAAAAQIKRPGAHPTYSAELEPHLILQHSRGWYGQGDGIGLGARVSIPLIDNGPIPSINNSLALGFGADVAFYNDCQTYFAGSPNCDSRILWFPVVAQWNFFFTKVVSVFGEVGLGIAHRSVSFDDNCPGDCSASDLDLFEPQFSGGGRFLFGDGVGLVVRLGTPYLSIGATFLL